MAQATIETASKHTPYLPISPNSRRIAVPEQDKAVAGLAGEVRALAGKLEEARASFADLPAPPKPKPLAPEPLRKRPLARPSSVQVPSQGLTGPQQRILDALA